MDLFLDPHGNESVLRPEARIAPGGAEEVHLLGWNVPAHELHTIPEHWLTQYEPQASMHYLLGMLYVAFTIVALTGNGLVIWVFSA